MFGKFGSWANTGLAHGLLLLFLHGSAMAERLDIVTFEPPPGWNRQVIADGLVFESRQAGTGTSCQMFLGKSRQSTAPLADELDREWASVLQGRPLVGDAQTPAQRDLGNGVTVAQRFAQIRAGRQPFLTMLNLLRKDDRLVMVLANLSDDVALDRCSTAIGDFIADLKFDTTPAAQPSRSAMPNAGATRPGGERMPSSDAQLAARFNNSVVGTWRFALTAVAVTLNAPTQTRNVIEIRFAPDSTYRIAYSVAVPGGGRFDDTETGSYRVEGQRILMRPRQAGGSPGPYALDWFFGDHPDYRGNWGLILRANVNWLGGFKDDWRTFKPSE